MKPLKEWTDKELIEFIDKNETQDLHELAGICSEILRRILNYRPNLLFVDPSQPTMD